MIFSLLVIEPVRTFGSQTSSTIGTDFFSVISACDYGGLIVDTGINYIKNTIRQKFPKKEPYMNKIVRVFLAAPTSRGQSRDIIDQSVLCPTEIPCL